MAVHRGFSGLETENTAVAFVAAGNRSYFGVECDIHLTPYKKFVIIHDETIERVCDTKSDAKIQCLVSEYNEEILKRLTENNCDIDIYYKAITEENIKQLHKNNIEVNCWTVDDKEEAKKACFVGC